MKKIISLFNTFPKNLKLQSILIVIFTLITSALEIISISSIFPLITLMTESSNAEKSFFYNFVYNFYTNLGLEFNLKNIAFFFSFVFLFKIFFNIFNANYQEKHGWRIYQFVSNTLLKIYMSKNFSFFLNSNTAVLMRNIINEASGLRSAVFGPLMGIISESIILISILTMLFFLHFVTTIKLVIFFLVIGVTYKISTKKFFLSLGEKRIYYSSYQYKLVNQIFSLIKEIKILRKEGQFFKYFSEINRKFSDSVRIFNVTTIIPKSIIEIFIILVFFYFILNKDLQNISGYLPYIAVYLGAAYRMSPSFIRIINCLRSFDFSTKPLDIFDKEFKDENHKDKNFSNVNRKYEKMKFENNININNITFSYENRTNNIFENFNLEIRKNEIIGIQGVSGKGKSTFANIICGLIKPDNGKILVDGKNIFENINSWQTNINIVQQDPILIDDTIENNITLSFFDEKIDRELLENCLIKSDIKDFISSLDKGLKSEVGEKGIQLSGGQKQRISFARALYSNPDLLILDEVTSALDKNTEKKILDTLLELKGNKTIIIISHKDEPLKICDRIINL